MACLVTYQPKPDYSDNELGPWILDSVQLVLVEYSAFREWQAGYPKNESAAATPGEDEVVPPLILRRGSNRCSMRFEARQEACAC